MEKEAAIEGNAKERQATRSSSPLFLGLDLSTQALKASLLDSELEVLDEIQVGFDQDLPHYGTKNGVLIHDEGMEKVDSGGKMVRAPILMYVEAFDLLLEKISKRGKVVWDTERIKAISCAAQQHATVYWSSEAESSLGKVSWERSLKEQMDGDLCFSRKEIPNWQDSSTLKECQELENLFKSKEEGGVGGVGKSLVDLTGSRAHARFSASQILKFRREEGETYRRTSRIGLVSSFMTTLLCLGGGGGGGGEGVKVEEGFIIKGIDESDACGMNLWDMRGEEQGSVQGRVGGEERLEPGWNQDLLRFISGETYFPNQDPLDGPREVLKEDEESTSRGAARELERKLGKVYRDGGRPVSKVGEWWVKRWGFDPECLVFPSTGDNPATFLAFSLKCNEAILSLGTSDTVMVSTEEYLPHRDYHAFVHPAQLSPTPPGGSRKYFNMLVYKNGSLAREWVRDRFFDSDWESFNLGAIRNRPSEKVGRVERAGFYWLKPEIIPPNAEGIHRFSKVEGGGKGWKRLDPGEGFRDKGMEASSILESQFLNYRSRSSLIFGSEGKDDGRGSKTPPTLNKIFAVGGASNNLTICRFLSDVMGCNVYRKVNEVGGCGGGGEKNLSGGPNLCSVASAYKAAWGWYRSRNEVRVQDDPLEPSFPPTFEEFMTRVRDRSILLGGEEEEKRDPRGKTRYEERLVASPDPTRSEVYHRFIDDWSRLEGLATSREPSL
ncbi:actin-like ATPase domain-containing protein [Violaceomyces palustris]|uniref:Actin-like ATPase domain-containing protein n=1 Tax=Violaceomyces palustris TaxID=1673888 RepID=A0ACD0NPU3_9BASI|nr:actin-like ATPase domain-containing protein [Violaceomyces palustris]